MILQLVDGLGWAGAEAEAESDYMYCTDKGRLPQYQYQQDNTGC